MFDWYVAEPPLSCPACERDLPRWQGKDGACELFVWRQGLAAPVRQDVDDNRKLSDDALARFRLPSMFVIYTQCECGLWVEALGRAPGGVWTLTNRLVERG